MQVTLSFNVPAGYKVVSTFYRNTGLGTVAVANEIFSSSGVTVFLYNIAGIKQSGKLTYCVLCTKSQFVNG